MADIFICYSSRDTRFAQELLDWLGREGLTAFMASDQESGIAAGEEWRWALQRNMREAQIVLVLISENWFKSDWCRGERRAAELMGKRVIPLVLGPIDPERLREISSEPTQWINIGADHTQAFERLHDGLAKAGLLRDTFPPTQHVRRFRALPPSTRRTQARFSAASLTSSRRSTAFASCSNSISPSCSSSTAPLGSANPRCCALNPAAPAAA